MSAGHRRRVAVIGSGVAGLTAAYVLRKSHEVTLYEADDRLGGHAHTHDMITADGTPFGVDSGFIVHNDRTYPTLLRLFAELGVATQPSDMSLSVCCGGCGLEYSGGQGAGGVLARPGSLLRPGFARMLSEVPRFHRHATRVLAGIPGAGGDSTKDGDGPTLGEFLASGGYSVYFRQHFITPLVAAVWSCAAGTALLYPARYLFTFLDNHGMLSLGGSPQWRTVVGGSRTYVQRAVKELAAVRTDTPVRSVVRSAASTGAVEVRDCADRVELFDAVVVATHPDQALGLLSAPTSSESAVLSEFEYSSSTAILHTDASVLPRSPRARASWNYAMPDCDGGAEKVRISYDLTRLQHLPGEQRYLVSLNMPERRLHPDDVVTRMTYAHPQYTPASVAAQKLLPALNGPVTAFAGAYHGWGFHEDGARSGLVAAESLGGAW